MIFIIKSPLFNSSFLIGQFGKSRGGLCARHWEPRVPLLDLPLHGQPGPKKYSDENIKSSSWMQSLTFLSTLKKCSKSFEITDKPTPRQVRMKSSAEMTILGVEFSAKFACALVFASGAWTPFSKAPGMSRWWKLHKHTPWQINGVRVRLVSVALMLSLNLTKQTLVSQLSFFGACTGHDGRGQLWWKAERLQSRSIFYFL